MRVQADHELVVTAEDLEQDPLRLLRVASLDRVDELAMCASTLYWRLPNRLMPAARRELDVLADQRAELRPSPAGGSGCAAASATSRWNSTSTSGYAVGVGRRPPASARPPRAARRTCVGGRPLRGHGDDLQAEQLPRLDQLLDLLARHRATAERTGRSLCLRHERAAAVSRLDESVADQDADRLARRAEADLVARGEVAVPGKLVARMQDAASRSASGARSAIMAGNVTRSRPLVRDSELPFLAFGVRPAFGIGSASSRGR